MIEKKEKRIELKILSELYLLRFLNSLKILYYCVMVLLEINFYCF